MVAHERWGQMPAGACPAPMTRAALLALRNSGQLSAACHYTITDFAQNRLVAGTTVTLHAVAANELGQTAIVNTPYDNMAWHGLYDIGNNVVTELRDNAGNVVIGSTSVGNFDWGNPAIQQCRVENATWNHTIGSARSMLRLRVVDGGTLTTTGMTGGSINDVEISKGATLNLTGANATVQRSTITEASVVNMAGYTAGGLFALSTVARQSNVTIGAGSGAVLITRVSFIGADVNHTGAGVFTLSASEISQAAAVVHSSPGSFTVSASSVTGSASSVVHTAGSVNILGCTIGPYGRVLKNDPASTGALSMNYCAVNTTGSVQQLGPGSLNIVGTTVSSGATVLVPNTADTTAGFGITYTTLEDNAVAAVRSTAGVTTVNYCHFNSAGYFNKTGSGPLSISYCTFFGTGRIDLNGARGLTAQYCTFSNIGRVLSNSTGAVSDQLLYTTISDYGVINFTASGAAANGVRYCSVRGLTGSISFTGTNTGTQLSRATVDNGVILFANNTVAHPTILDIGARDQGTLTCSGCTAAQDMRYITVQSYGRINVLNKTAASQLHGIDVSANGVFFTQGAAGSAYYCDVRQGTLNHNGGVLTRASKSIGGTLTTGAFTHTGIQHHVNATKTLTATNTSRADYQGLAAQLV